VPLITKLYPNPATSILWVSIKTNNSPVTGLQIRRMDGSLVRQIHIDPGTVMPLQIPIAELTSGLYLLQVHAGVEWSQSIAFLKQ
jgi:hypothetical protein